MLVRSIEIRLLETCELSGSIRSCRLGDDERVTISLGLVKSCSRLIRGADLVAW